MTDVTTVLISDPETTVVEIVDNEVTTVLPGDPETVIIATSEAGPAGPRGAPYQQLSFQFPGAVTPWVIVHGLGRYPFVVTVDLGGTEIIGDVSYIDANTVHVDWIAPRAGTAFVG